MTLESQCLEFIARKPSDPVAATEAFVRFIGEKQAFVRPAVFAALELGIDEFVSRMEANMNVGLDGCAEMLRLAVPEVDASDLRTVARSVRHLSFAGLLDRSMSREKFEEELRTLINGAHERSTPASVAS